MRADPLAALARLRAAETLMARRALATADAARAVAETVARDAAGALELEKAIIGGPAASVALVTWLPRGLAARDSAARGIAAAEAAVGERRGNLAAARAAERLVEAALDRRAATRRREALRREGARLDDLPRRDRAGAV